MGRNCFFKVALNFLVKKFSGTKKFYDKKCLGQKTFWVKKIIGQINIIMRYDASYHCLKVLWICTYISHFRIILQISS